MILFVVFGVIFLIFFFIWKAFWLQIDLRDENKSAFFRDYISVILVQSAMSLGIIQLVFMLTPGTSYYNYAIVVTACLFVLTQARIWLAYYMHFVYYPRKCNESGKRQKNDNTSGDVL